MNNKFIRFYSMLLLVVVCCNQAVHAEDNIQIKGTMRAAACTLIVGNTQRYEGQNQNISLDFNNVLTSSLYKPPYSTPPQRISIGFRDCDPGPVGVDNWLKISVRGKESAVRPGYLAPDQDEKDVGVVFRLYNYFELDGSRRPQNINEQIARINIRDTLATGVKMGYFFDLEMTALPDAILGKTLKPGKVTGTLLFDIEYE